MIRPDEVEIRGNWIAHNGKVEADLAKGLWCNAGTCAKGSPAGSPCGAGPIWECADGNYCTGMVPQMCAPKTALGAGCSTYFSCPDFADCSSGLCAPARAGTCLN